MHAYTIAYSIVVQSNVIKMGKITSIYLTDMHAWKVENPKCLIQKAATELESDLNEAKKSQYFNSR